MSFATQDGRGQAGSVARNVKMCSDDGRSTCPVQERKFMDTWGQVLSPAVHRSSFIAHGSSSLGRIINCWWKHRNALLRVIGHRGKEIELANNCNKIIELEHQNWIKQFRRASSLAQIFRVLNWLHGTTTTAVLRHQDMIYYHGPRLCLVMQNISSHSPPYRSLWTHSSVNLGTFSLLRSAVFIVGWLVPPRNYLEY